MAAVEYYGLGGSAWCSRPREAYLRPRFALLAVFFLFFDCIPYGWGQQTAATHSDSGLHLAQAGDLRGAESELRAAVALAPQNPEFLTDLATVLAMERKLEDSNIYFERALKLHPGNLVARRYLAANLWQLHRYRDARRNLELILKQNNNDAPSRLLMGMVAENMKDYRTATQMLASVPEEVRKQPESIAALAMSYYQLGEKVQAQKTLEEMQNHPTGIRAALLGAQIADEMADYDTAERLLSSLESNSADQADLGYRLAAVQYRAGRFEKSEKTLLRLLASGNETGQIFNLLGWCYEKRNQPEQAQQAFERGIGVQPNDESNYLDLQKILVSRDRLAAALEVAKRTTEALPNSARALAMRGSIEMRTSQFSNAVTSYRRAAELDPASIDSALGLADAEFAADMEKEAQTRYEAGIKQFPEDARFRIHYASALLKQAETGDPRAQGRAQELLKSAVKLDPSSADAYVQLGEIALNNGQNAEAMQDYGIAAKLSPENATAHFGLSKVYRRLGKSEEASRETKLFEKLQQSASQSPTSLPAENRHN